VPYLLRLWFGVAEPVRPLAYALSGFGLMLFKYAVEALLIGVFAAAPFWPWQFLNPLASMRTEMLGPAPWLGWAIVVWSLPFLWIALSMSVRRAADAGGSPWWGLLVLVPLVNLAMMLVLCFLPSSVEEGWLPREPAARDKGPGANVALALGASLMSGAAMLVVSIYLLESYGAALFLGTPLMMGVVAAYLDNRAVPRSYLGSAGMGLASVMVAAALLLLFALEGMICVMMAAPLILPLGAVGGLMGKAIADATRRPTHEMVAVLFVLPLLALAETHSYRAIEYEVMSMVEIDAPPEVVWEHVVDFPELPPPGEWYFRMGIACPERARIFGEGAGAIRHCEFSTGTFVEPITAWEPARRLAFDVTEQPAPMFELSPYRHVHPPHLDGSLRSNRGEFRLVGLPGGRTRLEGRTWYEFDMYPQFYWTLWSDLIIHRIHERVLLHVKRLAEDETGSPMR
jgi:uncharacterized membrane protein YhaH (DUF805 family)